MVFYVVGNYEAYLLRYYICLLFHLHAYFEVLEIEMRASCMLSCHQATSQPILPYT